jgi:MFS transporter, NRE family, putaive nickel resistance protein
MIEITQTPWRQALQNPRFARLYLAQTINLVGDALTWVGLSLLAFELAGAQAGQVLAIALTLRVATFVVLSPIAGVLADRVDRQKLMITTHVVRMGIVCLLPFVTQVWQIYAIVWALNLFYAFFAPTYTATIPLVTTPAERSGAIALSSATYQLLGVIGPGIAAGVAAFMGLRQVFWLDGLTFLIAAILIATLPGNLTVNQAASGDRTLTQIGRDLRVGTVCLFADRSIRYALLLQFVAAIAGAEILVNTVGYIQSHLQLGKLEYGWVMSAFGLGATLATVGLGYLNQPRKAIAWITIGASLITLALLPANAANLQGLMLLWVLAGIGQTLTNVPTQTLIADRVATELQGRVYGAHFAWSHLWWAFAYPIAGWMGQQFANANFFYSSLVGLGLLGAIVLGLQPKGTIGVTPGQWHEHEHTHNDGNHGHGHHATIAHRHLHFHGGDTVHRGH